MMAMTPRVSSKVLAVIGLFLILPAFYFVSASLLKYGLGFNLLFDPLEWFYATPRAFRIFNLVSPIVFLGGGALAVLLNIYPVLRLSVKKDEEAIVVAASVKTRIWNLSIIAVSALVLTILVGYAIAENVLH